MIRVVCGPPAAGKTTHVETNRQPGDLVVDLDAIRASGVSHETARRIQAWQEDHAREHTGGDVWIVRTLSDPRERAAFAASVGADQVTVIDPGDAVCRARLAERDGNDEKFEGVTRWRRHNPQPKESNQEDPVTETNKNTDQTTSKQAAEEQPQAATRGPESTPETHGTGTSPQEPQEPAEGTEPAPEAPEGTESEQEAPKGNREAAKYRARLRETEAERDQLAERVATLQRREVEQLAKDEWLVTNPATLWPLGFDLATVLDDHGDVDRDAAVTQIRAMVAEFGLTAPRRGLPEDFGARCDWDSGPADEWSAAFGKGS